jgi:RNA polymerase sigma-70 factor (ECF subfamily)
VRAFNSRATAPSATAAVRFLPLPLGDAALVGAVRAGERQAWAALFDRYGPYVERLIVRVVRVDSEIPDLIHEVFARALEGIDQLKEPTALKGWLGSITIFTARAWIRKRGSRRRWLNFTAPHELPEVPANSASPEVSETLERVYALLEGMPVDERIAFSLRFIDGMGLAEIAEIAGVSLSTVKRRLSRAERSFLRSASKDSLLSEHVAVSERWRQT